MQYSDNDLGGFPAGSFNRLLPEGWHVRYDRKHRIKHYGKPKGRGKSFNKPFQLLCGAVNTLWIEGAIAEVQGQDYSACPRCVEIAWKQNAKKE